MDNHTIVKTTLHGTDSTVKLHRNDELLKLLGLQPNMAFDNRLHAPTELYPIINAMEQMHSTGRL